MYNAVRSYQMEEKERRRGRRGSRSNEGPAALRLWASSRVFAPRLAPTAAHRFLSGAPHALHGSPHLLFTSVDVPPPPPPPPLLPSPLPFLLLSFSFDLSIAVRSLSLSLSIRAGVNTLAGALPAKYRHQNIFNHDYSLSTHRQTIASISGPGFWVVSHICRMRIDSDRFSVRMQGNKRKRDSSARQQSFPIHPTPTCQDDSRFSSTSLAQHRNVT